MSRRQTGWEMVLDMTEKALLELAQADVIDAHVTKAGAILADVLYLAGTMKEDA